MEEEHAEIHRVDITGVLDRPAIEALRLEILHLAKQYGVDIKEFRVEKVTDVASG